MISVEERVAELLAGDTTDNWHWAWFFRNAYPPREPGVDRARHTTSHVRSRTLHKVGVALIEGYDGGELAPRPRAAQEHRVGEVHVGSVLLHELDRFDGIDWWEVSRLLEPLVADADRTPPLQRPEAA